MYSSSKRDSIHINSDVVYAEAKYSASVLDRTTSDYFFELQETRLGLK